MTPVVEESEMLAMRLVGRFAIDDRGYSVINEDGQVIVYLDRRACNWDPDEVKRFEGLEVELVHLPEGQIALMSAPRRV